MSIASRFSETADALNRDLSQNPDLLDLVLMFFENDSEEVRSAAAFAAGEFMMMISNLQILIILGNLAVGSPTIFLPIIVARIGLAESEASLLLLLHALKEVNHSAEPLT